MGLHMDPEPGGLCASASLSSSTHSNLLCLRYYPYSGKATMIINYHTVCEKGEKIRGGESGERGLSSQSAVK